MKKLFALLVAFLLVCLSNAVAFAESSSAEVSTDGEKVNIDVDAVYSSAFTSSDVISVDISWGAMEFTYSESGAKVWDPDKHAYVNADDTSSSWSANGNSITVTNHSNVEIEAELSFAASVSGIEGEFTESSGTENDNILALASAVDTSVTNAPSATAEFNITAGSVSSSGKIGTITVSISKVEEAVETAVASLTDDGEYVLYSTEESGVYVATIARNYPNSSAYNQAFVYNPSLFLSGSIPEVQDYVTSHPSTKGLLLNTNSSISYITYEEDTQNITLVPDGIYILTIDFNTMTWSIELVSQIDS